MESNFTNKIEERNMIEGEINALKQLLSNTDYKALKYAEGLITDEEYKETLELRKSYREKINKYEEELKKLES